MATMNDWFHARLAHYRTITPHPGTTHRCGGLAEWREIDSSGQPTPGTEWCYCSRCGVRMRGEVSPWSELAHADWINTPYMRRQQRKWQIRSAHRRAKTGLLGSRKLIFSTEA